MLEANGLDEARRRIRAAYDPESLRDAGHVMVDLLANHLGDSEAGRGCVLPWQHPAELVRLAGEVLADPGTGEPKGESEPKGTVPFSSNENRDSPPSENWDSPPSENWDSPPVVRRFQGLVEQMLRHGINLHDPRYVGHQVAASVPMGGLFDAVGSVTNQAMAIYEMGPWATAVERALVDRLGRQIGWQPGDFAGVVTHGGSLANLTGLLTARNVSLQDCWERGIPRGDRPPVLLVQADAHHSVARSAGVLGLGTGQVLRVGLDSRRRMDPNRLDEALAAARKRNQPVVAVVACACATPIGAFDPLPEVAEVCRRHGAWLHVDAAHGGAACFSPRHRHLVAGLELADGLVWDAHKMLFMPALCAFVLYRRGADSFETFRQNAPYLFDPSAPGLAEYDSALRTVECTKRAAVFGLWGVWALFGPQLFADLVDVTFDLGAQLYAKLAAAPDFQPLHEPQCNIVVFRHVPETVAKLPPERLGRFQLELRRRVIESGEYYMVSTNIDGVGALRVTLINPLTTSDHLDRLLDAIREQGRELLREWS